MKHRSILCALFITSSLASSPIKTIFYGMARTLVSAYIGGGAGIIIGTSIGAAKGIYIGLKGARHNLDHQTIYETVGEISEPIMINVAWGFIDGAFYGTCIGAATGLIASVTFPAHL